MIGDSYATRAELKAYVNIPVGSTNSEFDLRIDAVLGAASRMIEDHCHRQFNNTEGVATPRVYKPSTAYLVETEDFYDSATVQIASAPVFQTFGTAWAANTFELEPRNGVVSGVPGWPYSRIALPSVRHLTDSDRVQVTAKWGWQSVPAPIRQACLIIGAYLWKINEAPLGLTDLRVGGGGDGLPAVRVQQIPQADVLMRPYILRQVMVG